jgi:hypothetical protein
MPSAMVVPPNAHMETVHSWGVSQNLMYPMETWSDPEAARRWWNFFPQRRDPDGSPAEPQPHELKMLIASEKKTKELRGPFRFGHGRNP